MGRDEPPFIYEAPRARHVTYPYSDFNPRAASQATYQALVDRSALKPKQQGPLINFNRHPDSYMAVPGQRPSTPPMSANTKRKVTILRGIQLGIRVLTALAAIGLLVATICIMNTKGAVTYLLRIPAAWDSVVSLYAVYHLCRPAKARTPASSASYHFFALFMDGGLISLYTYIALVSNNQHTLSSGAEERWTTFFSSSTALDSVLMAIFAGAVGVGGLHFISLILDIWLIIIFRQISALPPDMNPLEDNLTSRRIAKHKHKNSELSLDSQATTLTVNERKSAYLSGSTLSIDDQSRSSMLKDPAVVEARSIPFLHSRKESEFIFSPHTPETARWSRYQRGGYQIGHTGQDEAAQTAASNIHPEDSPHRGQDRRNAMYDEKTLSRLQGDDIAPPNYSSSQVGVAITTDLKRTSQRANLTKDNWYVHDDAGQIQTSTAVTHRVSEPTPNVRTRHVGIRYEANVPKLELYGLQQPLRMNPPTPPPGSEDPPLQNGPVPEQRSRSDQTSDALPCRDSAPTLVSESSSVYSDSVPALFSRPKSNTPKGRYYGDLSAATLAVRGIQRSPPKLGPYGLPSPVVSRSPSPPKHGSPGRVISRTGADIADEVLQWQNGGHSMQTMRNRREVSGKVAEEGRSEAVLQNGPWSGGRCR